MFSEDVRSQNARVLRHPGFVATGANRTAGQPQGRTCSSTASCTSTSAAGGTLLHLLGSHFRRRWRRRRYYSIEASLLLAEAAQLTLQTNDKRTGEKLLRPKRAACIPDSLAPRDGEAFLSYTYFFTTRSNTSVDIVRFSPF